MIERLKIVYRKYFRCSSWFDRIDPEQSTPEPRHNARRMCRSHAGTKIDSGTGTGTSTILFNLINPFNAVVIAT